MVRMSPSKWYNKKQISLSPRQPLNQDLQVYPLWYQPILCRLPPVIDTSNSDGTHSQQHLSLGPDVKSIKGSVGFVSEKNTTHAHLHVLPCPFHLQDFVPWGQKRQLQRGFECRIGANMSFHGGFGTSRSPAAGEIELLVCSGLLRSWRQYSSYLNQWQFWNVQHLIVSSFVMGPSEIFSRNRYTILLFRL